MASEELVNKVRVLVAQTIEESSGRAIEIERDTPLVSTGYLDSLTILQLFGAIQEDFGVELDVEDITESAFSTVEAIATLIEERS